MPSQAFNGFTPESLGFIGELKRLQADFDFKGAKAFFEANRDRHERELKLPLGLLAEELARRFKAQGLPLTGDRKSALFRINRDVRFSADKSPYKTHAGAVLSPDGSRKTQGVLYIHIDPAGCFIAAGFHMPEPAQLAKLRAMIRERPERFRETLAALAAKGLTLDSHVEGTLKRLPRGFEGLADPDLARAVKLKGYTVWRSLDDALVMSAGLTDHIERFAHEAMPLLHFGWEALARQT